MWDVYILQSYHSFKYRISALQQVCTENLSSNYNVKSLMKQKKNEKISKCEFGI